MTLNFCETCNVASHFCRCMGSQAGPLPPLAKATAPGRRKKPSRADKAHTTLDVSTVETGKLVFVGHTARHLKQLTLLGHNAPFFSETVLSRVLGRSDAKVVLAAVDALLKAVGEPR